MSGAGSAAVVFLMLFVIPRFVDIFEDLGQALPLPTQILLAVSTGLQQYWWLIALVLLVGVLLGRATLSTEAGRARLAFALPRQAVSLFVLEW